MTSRYSKDIEIFSAKQFIESVSEPQSSNVYFTIGKVTPWANDAAPPQANTSTSVLYELWRNMVGAKRLSGNDMRHVIPRHDWTSNTVYSMYDNLIDSIQLLDANNKFYVLTEDWNVYKCLSNNNGAISNYKPTSTATIGNFQTTDGYIWKYMYTLSAEERLNFITDDFIPVKTLPLNDGSAQWLVQDSSIDGAIDVIKVANGGTVNTGNISIVITGDGKEANAFAQVNTTTNTITSIIVDNRGSGYTYANVSFTGSNASISNVSARAIIGPPGGHGGDPLSELGGSYILMNLKLRGAEADDKLIVNNDYRQIAIIEEPYYWQTTTPASNTVFSQLTKVSLNGVSAEYIEDEIVYQGASVANATFKGFVAQWDSSNNIMKLSNVEGTPTAELLIGATSTGARFLDSVTAPDLRPYSGKLLYINNIKPIERSEDQTESFKIVLKF